MARVATARRIEVRHLPWAEVITAGGIAGLLGGVFMGIFAMAHAALTGPDVFYPLRLIGATYQGPVALVAGTGTVLAGLALHLLVSMSLGVLFAALVDRTTTFGAAIIGATAFALTALLIMTLAVVPLVNPTMQPRITAIAGPWFVQHLLYGLGLAFAPLLRRHLQVRREEEAFT